MLRRLLLILLILPTAAFSASWQIDPGTRVAADVAWRGRVVEVRFPRLAGRIEFDEHQPERARAQIVVDATAATAGLGPVDALIRSDGYLDSASHPTITFQLDRLVQTSRSTADIFGRITLRGVTRPIAFKAAVVRYGPSASDPSRFEAGFDLTGRIDRTEFGSTGGLPEVAAALPVRIRLLMSSR